METKVIQPTTGPSRQVISEANPDPAVRAWVHDQWMRDYLHARGMLWVLILRLITGMSGELIKTDETPNKEIPPRYAADIPTRRAGRDPSRCPLS